MSFALAGFVVGNGLDEMTTLECHLSWCYTRLLDHSFGFIAGFIELSRFEFSTEALKALFEPLCFVSFKLL